MNRSIDVLDRSGQRIRLAVTETESLLRVEGHAADGEGACSFWSQACALPAERGATLDRLLAEAGFTLVEDGRAA